MDEVGQSLWARVCATVTRLGQPKPPRPAPPVPRAPPLRTTLDLHGHTVEEAYRAVKSFLDESACREVTIITGKSGEICREFPTWMYNLGYRYEIMNGGGAFRVRT